MSFTETPAAAFTASVSTISAATANTWKANIADSLDTVGGGTYTNVSAIDWLAGSAGWRFYAAVAIKSTGTLTLDAGATVTINADPSLFGTMRVGVGGAGGGVRWYATSTLQVDDTVAMSIAGDATWTGASTQVHASSSTDTYSSGSTFTIQSGSIANLNLGGVSASGVTFIGANGAAVWNGASTATWQTASVSNWNSGANLTISSGAIVTSTIGGGAAAGAWTWGVNAVEVHASGSTDTYQSGSSLTTNTGAIVNLNIGKTNAGTVTNGSLAVEVHESSSSDTYQSGSVLNLDGTVTRTGRETLSGTGAYTSLRYVAGLDANTSYNGQHYDIIDAGVALTANREYTLTNGNLNTLMIRNASAFSLTIKEGASTLAVLNPGAGFNQTIVMFHNGTLWVAGPLGGLNAN